MKSKIIDCLLKTIKIIFVIVIFFIIFYFIFSLIVRPSLNREWNSDQEILSRAVIDKNLVSITNIRNINYRSTTDYDVGYYDKTFDLNKLNSVWYMVEPFAGHGAGAAHTLVSFGFEDGEYVAISVEIRKEKGEKFGALKGLFRQYELVYVIADERDVIKLRSNHRKDDVFLYPIVTSKENMQKLFVSMLNRANKLATEPEFYNTLTSTCTTNIVSHVNEIVPGRIPFSYKVLMPAYSDELAYKIGLIDNSVPLETLREKYHINERAMKYADSPDFSKKIREFKNIIEFGEPELGDLDNDGDIDKAIFLVDNSEGSGVFYYASLLINDNGVFKPTNEMFLGDRIAPQGIDIIDGRAVFNFAVRKNDEPMTAKPSIGKSIWVHYDKKNNNIGEWVKDFEGESR